MLQLVQALPDYQVLLSLEPEELAGKPILLLRKHQKPMFHPNRLRSEVWGFPHEDCRATLVNTRKKSSSHMRSMGLAGNSGINYCSGGAMGRVVGVA